MAEAKKKGNYGRPRVWNPKSVQVNFRMTKGEEKMLDRLCDKLDISRAEVLRMGLKELDRQQRLGELRV